MDTVYTSLLLLRILLVFIPQYGYIHPDEFFQTTEVVVGDVFDIEVNKPWEFTTLPIRSVLFTYTLYGLPLKLLRVIGQIYPVLISGYWILVVPRLIQTLLSLVVDYTIYRLCRSFYLNAKLGLYFTASSYVMLTYMTRTFSNSVEGFLFACVLLLVFTDKTVELYVATDFGVDDTDNTKRLHRTSIKGYQMNKKKKSDLSVMYRNSLQVTSYPAAALIGFIGVAGLFNRPTFALLAICPAILYCDAKKEKITLHAVFVGAGAMCAFIIFTLADTLYFSEHFGDLFKTCNVDKSSFFMCYLTAFLRWLVITPYNFLIYNSSPYNLAEHGLHPRYLHFLLNLILLFGPLTFFVYKKLFHLFFLILKKKKFDQSYLPLIMAIVPVILLSVFPHQEPRFLIPVLPLVVITGVEQIEGRSNFRKLVIFVWILFNILLTTIFGVLHQGGVVQNLLHAENQLNSDRTGNTGFLSTKDKLVFFHTYMPPHSLLLSKSAKYQIVDVKGGSIDYLLQYLHQHLEGDKQYQQNKESSNIFIVTPSTVVREFQVRGINFTIEFVYRGHLSMEDPPDLAAIYGQISNTSNILQKMTDFLFELSNALTLHVIKVPCDQFLVS